jgi:pimeloyl-ACP methyl ester carboxylesterase
LRATARAIRVAVLRSVPTILLSAAAAGALLLAPPSAHAVIDMEPCFEESEVECGTFKVPIDRSGSVPGTIRLRVTRIPAPKPSGKKAVFAFAGGPGQGATGFTEQFGFVLRQALRTRDLIVFDQRGTGESGPLDCRAVDGVREIKRAVTEIRDCAQKLGATAPFYTTRDTVEDIEAVRAEFGYDKISLYGVSYGTKVELGYAATFPDRVERMVLDSVVALDGPDPLLRENFAAMPRIMSELCGAPGTRCRGVTADPVADLGAVGADMADGPLTGTVYTAKGRARTASIDASSVYTLLVIGDFESGLRALMPAAIASAALGDPAPLLRVGQLLRPVGIPQPPPLSEFSTGLWLATVCAEESFPWDPSTPPEQRRAEAEGRTASLGAGAFAPFNARAALDWDVIQMCQHWPSPTRAPIAGDLAKVTAPTLLVNGRADLRTPLETAERVAKQLPAASVLPVSRAGHSVVGGQSECADVGTNGFLRGLTPPASCKGPRSLPIRPLAPTSITQVPRAPGVGGTRGRVAKAIEVTVLDTLAELDLIFNDAGGLRGGSFRIGDRGIEFRDLVHVPGVVVSGAIDGNNWLGVLRVRGSAGIRGSIRIGKRVKGRNVVKGTLDGRRISTRFALPAPVDGLGDGEDRPGPRVPIWAPELPALP